MQDLPILTRSQMEPLYQAELHLDEAVQEGPNWMVFRKTVHMDDPFIRGQKAVPPEFPHHYAGENFISMTGESAYVMLRHKGILPDGWRGHGTRIRDAIFRASVLVGEDLWVRVELQRHRKLGGRLFATFKFHMWKLDASGQEVVCYESVQDAAFFPVGQAAG